MWADVALILGAYLLGSVPHLSWLARLRHVELGGDFHQALWHRAGRLTGFFGVVGELAKGAIPVLVGRALDFSLVTLALAGLAAVGGQMWPVFARFDGEKGNSIAIAASAALVPLASLFAIIPVIIALAIRTVPRLVAQGKPSAERRIVGGPSSRSLPLGMAAGFIVWPLAAWYFGEPPEIIGCGAALWVMIMARRLTAGLRQDLKVSRDTRGIPLRRLLYDRATAAWRAGPLADRGE